jgi:hypothetical protein
MCHEATVRHRGAVVVRLLLLLLRCCCCCRCCASRDNGIVRIQYMYCRQQHSVLAISFCRPNTTICTVVLYS